MKLNIFAVLAVAFALHNSAKASDPAMQENPENESPTQEQSNEQMRSPCGINEKLHICGNQCDLTIWNHGIPFRTLRSDCREACVCRRGFVRNEYGVCVMNTLPGIENEDFRRCETGCEMECDCRGKYVSYLFTNCQHGLFFKSGYRCKQGYVRHFETRKCVPNTECVLKN